jgi:cysteine desulfurase
MIYLDNASSTKPHPEVLEAMAPYLGAEYGNASSLHAAGRRARKAVEDAREAVAAALGADPKEILFTSGATESNNLAIAGAAEALRDRGDHVVTSAIEHPCVLESCARLESRGFRVTRLPVDREGRVDPGDVARAMTPRTVLVSVMGVNHEVGSVQPVREIREAARGAVFHSDAAQAVGKIPVDVRGCDLLTFSAHKIHGPKGVGGLWVRRGTPLASLLVGGGQEFERRAGTENVAGIAGLAAAVTIAVRDLEKNARRMRALRDRLQAGLVRLPGARVNGSAEPRAPHLVNVFFEGVDAESFILALDAEGVCVSSGSACASMSLEPSPVLRAMGRPAEEARSSARFGVSVLTTDEEIEAALEIVPRVVGRLRRTSAVSR